MLSGRLISQLSWFKSNKKLEIALSFSGGLFLSIAILHIIPEASHNFNVALSQTQQPIIRDELNQEWFLPYTQIIASVTYMLVMLLDKILIGDSHHHQSQNEEAIKQENPAMKPPLSQRQTIVIHQIFVEQKQNKQRNDNSNNISNCQPIVLQLGMSIHAFFECLAVGLQQSIPGTLSLAVAIAVHKWAQGLTLGLMYEKSGYSKRMVDLVVLFQALINVVGLCVGSMLAQQGPLVIAIFMSVSAGTFLYISTGEVLPEQLKHPTKGKAFAMILSLLLVTSLFFIENAGNIDN